MYFLKKLWCTSKVRFVFADLSQLKHHQSPSKHFFLSDRRDQVYEVTDVLLSSLWRCDSW